MHEYFPEPKSFRGSVKVELDLSKYATKVDLKNVTGVETSKFTIKVDLARLRSDVDKLDIDKLKNISTNLSNLQNKVDKLDVAKLVHVPVDFNNLSDVVKNGVVKNDAYNAKTKNIEDKIHDITNLATKTTLNAKINELKCEIPSISNLDRTVALNSKINEVKNKIHSTTNLANTTSLIAIENKITNASNLVKKALTITQKLVKLKRKLMIIIMINILLLRNLVS